MTTSRNNTILFWASFLTLIAAGMGFSIRTDIIYNWGQKFGFTQTELGEITGMGLVGFGLTIIVFSFFADRVGYGSLMVVAFLLHVAAALTTLAAPLAAQKFGKDGAYWCLYIGALCFSLANGTCEAVINPLTATLFPTNKTHWLNILHAGWPGGLVLGALCSLGLNQLHVGWQVKWRGAGPHDRLRRPDAGPALPQVGSPRRRHLAGPDDRNAVLRHSAVAVPPARPDRLCRTGDG